MARETEAARYRLTQPAHIAPVPGGLVQLMQEDDEIVYLGKPGFHMVPLNDAARSAFGALSEKEQNDPLRQAIHAAATRPFSPEPRFD
jgi:hypothetical protein